MPLYVLCDDLDENYESIWWKYLPGGDRYDGVRENDEKWGKRDDKKDKGDKKKSRVVLEED